MVGKRIMVWVVVMALGAAEVLAAEPGTRATEGATRPAGAATEPMARFGVPSDGLGAQRGFFGAGGGAVANRMVYVVAHSGTMIDTFDFVREEIKKTVGGLTPAQQFSVVMFTEAVDAVFPKEVKAAGTMPVGGTGLTRATPSTKKDFGDFMDGIRAAGGKGNDLRAPVTDAMKKAFEMKPQIIYLLVEGNMDAKVADDVKAMNAAAGGKVHVYTIGFVKVGKEAEETLKTIAADNGGKYKFVAEKDLGK